MRARTLLSHFFHIPIDEVEQLPITLYQELLEEALFLTSLYRQSEINLLTGNDTKLNRKLESAWAKKEGLVN